MHREKGAVGGWMSRGRRGSMPLTVTSYRGRRAKWLFAELDFREGVFLMTGTGLVPPDEFSLIPGDAVRIALGDLVLDNEVE